MSKCDKMHRITKLIITPFAKQNNKEKQCFCFQMGERWTRTHTHGKQDGVLKQKEVSWKKNQQECNGCNRLRIGEQNKVMWLIFTPVSGGEHAGSMLKFLNSRQTLRAAFFRQRSLWNVHNKQSEWYCKASQWNRMWGVIFRTIFKDEFWNRGPFFTEPRTRAAKGAAYNFMDHPKQMARMIATMLSLFLTHTLLCIVPSRSAIHPWKGEWGCLDNPNPI